jgi:hypothetical protein
LQHRKGAYTGDGAGLCYRPEHASRIEVEERSDYSLAENGSSRKIISVAVRDCLFDQYEDDGLGCAFSCPVSHPCMARCCAQAKYWQRDLLPLSSGDSLISLWVFRNLAAGTYLLPCWSLSLARYASLNTRGRMYIYLKYHYNCRQIYYNSAPKHSDFLHDDFNPTASTHDVTDRHD